MGSLATSPIAAIPSLQSTVPIVESDLGPVPVFWIYVDAAGHWRLRKEGGAAEAAFASRAECLAFVQDLVRNARPYRLFIETEEGRIVAESHGTPTFSAASALQARAVAEDSCAASTSENGDAELSNGLAWANRLASAARVSPSRMSFLAGWLQHLRS